MKVIEKISNFFTKYLPYIVLVVSALAFFVPKSMLWAAPHTTLLLQIIMFGMGLTLTIKDFEMVVKKPWQVLIVTVLQFGWMPLSAFLISKLFGLEAGIAAGVILVGCCPGGTASNVMTYIANGDVPLSVTCTSVSTLLAPFLTPLLVKLYAGAIVEVSLQAMFMSIVKVVLVPIAAGIILNLLIGKFITPFKKLLPTISGIGVLLVLGSVVAVNRANIIASGITIFIVCLLHNVLGLAAGYFGGKLFKMGEKQTRAAAIEVGMQNAGLGSNLAMAHFEPISALAGAAFGIWHNFTGALFAYFCNRKDAKAAAANAAKDESAETKS